MNQLPPIENLRCFVAVAEELDFRKAAAHLKITESALSTRMQKLEDLLGAQLCARGSSTETRLTPAGRVLLADARALLQSIGKMVDTARGLAAAGAR